MNILEEGAITCCYARSDKSWVQDPAGIPWEAYRTMENAQFFSENMDGAEGPCCTPDTPAKLISLKPSASKGGC